MRLFCFIGNQIKVGKLCVGDVATRMWLKQPLLQAQEQVTL